jgi:pyruvate/2-oxoglutarate/acetoin dehydrogenase E1 component
MKYKDAITMGMELLARNPKTMFFGYNVKYGGMANGTLKNVPENQLFETPVAENLMVAVAIGMSLEGYFPVVYFERFDFILNALDAIVNHLEKIKDMSHNEYDPKVIIRAVIGNTKAPLYTGATHTQDFTEALSKLTSIPVVKLPHDSRKIIEIYENAINKNYIIVEEKDEYDIEC